MVKEVYACVQAHGTGSCTNERARVRIRTRSTLIGKTHHKLKLTLFKIVRSFAVNNIYYIFVLYTSHHKTWTSSILISNVRFAKKKSIKEEEDVRLLLDPLLLLLSFVLCGCFLFGLLFLFCCRCFWWLKERERESLCSSEWQRDVKCKCINISRPWQCIKHTADSFFWSGSKKASVSDKQERNKCIGPLRVYEQELVCCVLKLFFLYRAHYVCWSPVNWWW